MFGTVFHRFVSKVIDLPEDSLAIRRGDHAEIVFTVRVVSGVEIRELPYSGENFGLRLKPERRDTGCLDAPSRRNARVRLPEACVMTEFLVESSYPARLFF